MQPLGLCYAKEKSYQFASEMTSFFFLSAEILNVHQIMEWAILGNTAQT